MAKKTKSNPSNKHTALKATVVKTFTPSEPAHLLALGLRAHRKALNLTQGEYAKALGVQTAQLLTGYENGRIVPRVGALMNWFVEYPELQKLTFSYKLGAPVTLES